MATLWCIPFVTEALPIFEDNYSHDIRPRQCLEAAIKYAQGERRGQELRRLSMAAFKLGKEVDEPAKYVTKSASAIAAVAYTHTDLINGDQGWKQARHILGPIVYAAYALELSKTSNHVSDDMIERAIKVAPLEVKTLIRSFQAQPGKKSRIDGLFKKLDNVLRL